MKHPTRLSRQAGAATLVVVMVLFFIMAMMAAFANRSLVFEQRVASNYFRTGVAFETAESGVDWALALLNGGNVDANCKAVAAATSTFRQRYLSIGSDRVVSPIPNPASPPPALAAGCIRSAGNGWICSCPDSGALVAPAVAVVNALQPMFSVSFKSQLSAAEPGVVQIEVDGCTDIVSNCTTDATASARALGRATLKQYIALVSAIKVPPPTPLTVRGHVALDGAGLGLHNADPTLSGLVLQAGGAIDISGTPDRIDSVPGTPVQQTWIANDPVLAAADADRMFAMYFGMSPKLYSNQPTVRRVSCSGDCGAKLVEAYAAGARQIWVDGPINIISNITLGSLADPAVIISDGALVLDGPMQIFGVLYARGAAQWTNASGLPAVLTGALLADGNWQSAGTVDLWYRASVLNVLNNQTGSFVRVPGSWWN